MLFINATLSKDQPNKQSLYHQQARRHRVLFQIFLHVILQMSALYFLVIIMVGFSFADTKGLC